VLFALISATLLVQGLRKRRTDLLEPAEAQAAPVRYWLSVLVLANVTAVFLSSAVL
jgi:hypothetical protein